MDVFRYNLTLTFGMNFERLSHIAGSKPQLRLYCRTGPLGFEVFDLANWNHDCALKAIELITEARPEFEEQLKPWLKKSR